MAYPREEFVSASGVVPTLSEAQLAAKAELTRIFASDISTDMRIVGLEVPLFWRDPNRGAFSGGS